MFEKSSRLFKYRREWFLLLALLNILDVLLTVWILSLDDSHTEFNVIVVFLIKYFGWAGTLLFKLAVSAVAFWVCLEEKKRTTEERFDKFLLLVVLVDVVLFLVVVSTITTIFLIKY